MTTEQIVMLIAVLALIGVLVVRRGGPSVTRIDRTTKREKEDDE